MIKLVLKKTIFLDESLSFDLSLLFSWNSQKVTSSQTIERYTQDQRLKLTQRTMKKVILISQRVISVFKIQDNQMTTLNNVCWIFNQTSLISKNTFQNWHLSDFIPTTRLWIDMIFGVWELIPEQDCQTRRTLTEFAKSLIEMTSTFLDTPWKIDHRRAIQWIMRRKTSSIKIS
jgi:hypothetical protein